MGEYDGAIESIRQVEEAQRRRRQAASDRENRISKVERILTCSGLSAEQVSSLAELIAIVYDGERDEIPDY